MRPIVAFGYITVVSLGIAFLVVTAPQMVGAAKHEETLHDFPEPLALVVFPQDPKVFQSARAQRPSRFQEAPWHKAKATFYGARYSKGIWHTADGTRYSATALTCATRLVKLGTIIEVRYKGRVLRLKVNDTPARKFGHRLDLPDATWLKLTSEKHSRGIVTVEWRVAAK